jgi:hypothetical protein
MHPDLCELWEATIVDFGVFLTSAICPHSTKVNTTRYTLRVLHCNPLQHIRYSSTDLCSVRHRRNPNDLLNQTPPDKNQWLWF